MIGQAGRAIYATPDLDWHSRRDDSAGDNDTSSRPPEDLGGTLRRTFRTTLRSYDSRTSGGLQYPLSPGVRGKYGETGQTNDTAAVPGHLRYVCDPNNPPHGCPYFTEYGQSVFTYIVLYID